MNTHIGTDRVGDMRELITVVPIAFSFSRGMNIFREDTEYLSISKRHSKLFAFNFGSWGPSHASEKVDPPLPAVTTKLYFHSGGNGSPLGPVDGMPRQERVPLLRLKCLVHIL